MTRPPDRPNPLDDEAEATRGPSVSGLEWYYAGFFQRDTRLKRKSQTRMHGFDFAESMSG
jgi:hypothetical protein